MAQRRMFSQKIIGSARFLKMPIDAQLLYFHLGLRADDDGVVEAFIVMRLIGSTEDNLRVLAAKGFVQVLNYDLVSFITDWREHNKLRADRKVDSIYKDLLLKIVPDAEVLGEKQRVDRVNEVGQPRDNQRAAQVSIGKVSIGKVSKLAPQGGAEVNEIINLFKEVNPSVQRLYGMKTQRGAVERLLKQYGKEELEKMITSLAQVNRLRGITVTTTPYQLEANIGKIKARVEQERNNKKGKGIVI